MIHIYSTSFVFTKRLVVYNKNLGSILHEAAPAEQEKGLALKLCQY